jgi:hypothetical protein
MIWYVRIEGDATKRVAASVEGIRNGDQVDVAGELKPGGDDNPYEFWAVETEKGE